MEWKRVTKFSQAVAIILALVIFGLGVWVGFQVERASVPVYPDDTTHNKVADTFPPEGWYMHVVPAPEGERVVLFTQSPKKVTVGPHFSYHVGDAIGVTIFKTKQSPQKYVDIMLGAMLVGHDGFSYKTWSKCGDDPMFSYAYQQENFPKQRATDIFKGNKVYSISLSPDKDAYHDAFEQIVKHYCEEN